MSRDIKAAQFEKGPVISTTCNKPLFRTNLTRLVVSRSISFGPWSFGGQWKQLVPKALNRSIIRVVFVEGPRFMCRGCESNPAWQIHLNILTNRTMRLWLCLAFVWHLDWQETSFKDQAAVVAAIRWSGPLNQSYITLSLSLSQFQALDADGISTVSTVAYQLFFCFITL